MSAIALLFKPIKFLEFRSILHLVRFSMSFVLISVGVLNAEGPPVPIPNTEVKLCCGDNTCLATDRKDSSMPTHNIIPLGI